MIRPTPPHRPCPGLKSITPRLTARTRCAASLATSSRALRPLGKWTVAVSSHSGDPLGTRFWKKNSPPAPSTNRFHRRRPLAEVDQGRIGDLDVVVRQIELRVPGLLEEELVGVGEPNLPCGHLDRRVAPSRRHRWKDRAAFESGGV
jgi:hypothetical protein